MQIRAVLKYSRISPRKVDIVADVVRNKPVEQALFSLKFLTKRGARILEKVIHSALANAEQNPNIEDIDNLYVSQIYVGGGPTLKRFRAAPMGRAVRIRKRTSHVTVVLEEKGGKAQAAQEA
jgi:large subunit ribosomal protein L22